MWGVWQTLLEESCKAKVVVVVMGVREHLEGIRVVLVTGSGWWPLSESRWKLVVACLPYCLKP